MNLNEISKLKDKKYRDIYRHVFIEGEHLVNELEKSAFVDCEIICEEKYASYNSRFSKRILTHQQFIKLSDVQNPQGIAALVPIDNFKKIEKQTKNLMFYEIQDPGNLGSIIRSIAWFGGFNLCLSPESADPFNPKTIRASMGGIFYVPIFQEMDLKNVLLDSKKTMVLDINSEHILGRDSILEFDNFLLGNEARGFDFDIESAIRFKIDGTHNIESLNLAQSAGILLYEYSREKNAGTL